MTEILSARDTIGRQVHFSHNKDKNRTRITVLLALHGKHAKSLLYDLSAVDSEVNFLS